MNKHSQVKSSFGDANRIILAGNPNVGKSTLFNAVTGLKQHTGNWSGKTVDTASGFFTYKKTQYEIIDIPGCYSLTANSEEEACAAKAITSLEYDAVIVVCNAFNLERNLNLVLQILEVTNKVLVALNFCDEAEKQGIIVDADKLSSLLSIPVIKINARKKRGIDTLMNCICENSFGKGFCVSYGKTIEKDLKIIENELQNADFSEHKRYMALRMIENNKVFCDMFLQKNGNNDSYIKIKTICDSVRKKFLNNSKIMSIAEYTSYTITKTSERIMKSDVLINEHKKEASGFADRILTGKISGFVIMFITLFILILTTVKLANYPSEFLSDILFGIEDDIYKLLKYIKIPGVICDALVYGGYRVLAWVVAVMLPPMAIFFPLFTILEDVGYLPRIAFNLDKCFKKCSTCGKQSLTMCMGLGCNAVGVTGARIIDSPRERLIAILTNSFIPCNGKFPTLICLSMIFFSNQNNVYISSLYVALYVVIAIVISMGASKLLSKILLKGVPSSFSIELPSFRKPQIGQIVVRSLINRTFLILLRAVRVAFPMGILIWIMTNISVNGESIVSYMVYLLEPFGRVMGLDGTVLTAFVLGLPANEIILPIITMLYSSQTMITSPGGYEEIMLLLTSNGWGITTAACAVTFLLMHWPCSTTLLTIKKETTGKKWVMLAFALPTFFGVVSCVVINLVFGMLL